MQATGKRSGDDDVIDRSAACIHAILIEESLHVVLSLTWAIEFNFDRHEFDLFLSPIKVRF